MSKYGVLEVAEGRQYQSATESLAYTITTTNVVSSPTTTVVTVYDEDTGEDVEATVMPTNSPSESGDVITLSLLKALTKGHTYRIEVKFTVGSNIYEHLFLVDCLF